MAVKKLLYIGNKLSGKGFTPTAIDELAPLLRAEGYDVIAVSDRVNAISRMLHMVYAVIAHRHVDVVLIDVYSTMAFYYAYFVSLLCRMLAIPYVPILHGGKLPERFRQSPGLCRHIFGYSVVNVAVSPFVYQCLEANNYKRMLIPNALQLQNYTFKHRANVAPFILWVRSFHELYDPQLAIRAFDTIKHRYPSAKLTMVGPDKDGSLQRCISLCAELGLGDAVTFTGKLSKDDWASLSSGFGIFLNTSLIDNLPVTIIEAQALGFPIVSTNVGSISNIINDAETGLLVNTHTPEAVADAIERLLCNNKLAADISLSARASAERYDWSRVRQEWHSLFENVC